MSMSISMSKDMLRDLLIQSGLLQDYQIKIDILMLEREIMKKKRILADDETEIVHSRKHYEDTRDSFNKGNVQCTEELLTAARWMVRHEESIKEAKKELNKLSSELRELEEKIISS